MKYQMTPIWPNKVGSGRLWQEGEEIFVGSDSGRILVVGVGQFKGERLVEMLDKNNYNPYRVTK